MEESERLKLINEITNEFQYFQSLEEKKERLKELENDPKIKEYLSLINDIKNISYSRSLSPRTYDNFDNFFKKRMKDKLMNTSCTHDIYIYTGSHILTYNKYYDEYFDDLVKNEECEFDHNEYMCLECGEKIMTKDWEKFERDNFVLKNYGGEGDNFYYINTWCYYNALYCESLYSMSSEEAKAKVIETFKTNCPNGIISNSSKLSKVLKK